MEIKKQYFTRNFKAIPHEIPHENPQKIKKSTAYACVSKKFPAITCKSQLSNQSLNWGNS